MRITNFSNWFNVTTKIGVGYVLLNLSTSRGMCFLLCRLSYLVLTLSTSWGMCTLICRRHGVCAAYFVDTVMCYLLCWHGYVVLTFSTSWGMCFLLCRHSYVVLTFSTSWGMWYLLCRRHGVYAPYFVDTAMTRQIFIRGGTAGAAFHKMVVQPYPQNSQGIFCCSYTCHQFLQYFIL